GKCSPACPADLDGDGFVSAADLSALLGNWGNSGTGDIDGDGFVNAADLSALLGAWGPCS
ncbi:MAG: GC-type dockerin domain-anchored protein, partial [bacterium]